MKELSKNINALLDDTQSCMLATLSSQGLPEASTTPYLLFGEHIYLLISELAAHTKNLAANQHCSLMICEDESKTKNIFARKRLILKGHANFLARDTEQFAKTISAFEEARGNTVALLKTLKDFHIVEITVASGSYVEGFGAAYSFPQLRFDEAKQETGK